MAKASLSSRASRVPGNQSPVLRFQFVEVESHSGDTVLRTAVLTHPHDLKRIRPLWESLEESSSCLTMFQRFVWHETAARIFHQRQNLRFVYAEDDNGMVILPTVFDVHSRTLTLAGERLFDYRDAVLVGDPGILQPALSVAARWDLPFNFTAVRGACAAQKWQSLQLRPFANAPAVASARLTADEFLAAHNRLGRHSRRIRKQGIVLTRHSYASPELARQIYEAKGKQGTDAENLFSDPLRRHFMVELCSDPSSECEIFTYDSGAALVAALVTFRDGRVRHFYTVYFDDSWGSYSPGQVLLFEVTAMSLEEGLDCDYMTGEYPYKNRLATDQVPLYTLAAEPRQLRELGRDAHSQPQPVAA